MPRILDLSDDERRRRSEAMSALNTSGRRGGWGDDIDWTSRIAELRERTSQWLEVLADLRPRLVNELAEDVPT
jgi:hypothetical protein